MDTPLYPGLIGSATWERAWRSHGNISLSSTAAWLSDEDREACVPRVIDFDFSQSNADPSRAQQGRGTSACAWIQARLFHRFFESQQDLHASIGDLRAFMAEA
eukprot:180103-Karenia_brevis.AAC.1